MRGLAQQLEPEQFEPRGEGRQPRILLSLCCLLSGLLFVTAARADDDLGPVPSTFSYTQPAEQNRVRALLELTGVYTFGFTFYVSTNRLLPDWNVHYSWPVYRKKLLGQGLELDINGLNTNFVGHPSGGSMYYIMARSNQLNIAESEAFAIGGSLLWELFGEVREYISINDMIVTPLAGVAIAEPLMQLGAFFDRSSPALRNRILAVFFTPIKSLNDALDGRTLARSEQLDEHGFPANEYHRFDLRTGASATVQSPAPGQFSDKRTFEYRLALASALVRLPGYDSAGHGSRVFSDGNLSSMDVSVALNGGGLVDLEVHTLVGFAGYYFRNASRAVDGTLHGQGLVLGLTLGYQYVLHDYDRDAARPHDRISSVQPLGAVMEHRLAAGMLRWVTHVEAGLDFGGARPYALTAYRQLPDAPMLNTLTANNRYYFMRGGHLLATMSLELDLFELAGKVRYESYTQLDQPVPVDDIRTLLEGRASLALGRSAARLSLLVQQRTRSGHMGEASASRRELSVGLELGARY
jgi:hypothetical protein